MIVLYADGTHEAATIDILDDDVSEAKTRWCAARPSNAHVETLLSTNQDVGLFLDNTQDIDTLSVDVGLARFVLLEFPSFTDGRAYSQARMLRERRRFDGLIVASGDIQRDQAFYLRRCGFDAFLVANAATADSVAAGFEDFTHGYQGPTVTAVQVAPFTRRRG